MGSSEHEDLDEDEDEFFDINIHGSPPHRHHHHHRDASPGPSKRKESMADRIFFNGQLHHLRAHQFYTLPMPHHHPTSSPLSAHPEEEEEAEEQDNDLVIGQQAELFNSCRLDPDSPNSARLRDSTSSTKSGYGDKDSTSRDSSSSSSQVSCSNYAAETSSKGLVAHSQVSGPAALSLKSLLIGGLYCRDRKLRRRGQEGGIATSSCNDKKAIGDQSSGAGRRSGSLLMMQQSASRNMAWQRYVEKARANSSRPTGIMNNHNKKKPWPQVEPELEESGIRAAILHCKQRGTVASP